MDNKKLETIKQMLDIAENNIKTARRLLFEQEFTKQASQLKESKDGKIIEGVYDGENMVGPDGKKYPVPANYASKSKLVAGDVLKLTILADGSFVFKQIGPVQRKKLIGSLEAEAENRYQVVADGKRYNVLLASVTYFKGKPGDQVTIILPKDGESNFAAIENIIPKGEGKKKAAPTSLLEEIKR